MVCGRPSIGRCEVFLSDRGIRQCIRSGRIEIDPYDESRVQPASVDLTLDRHFKVYADRKLSHHIDPRKPQMMQETHVANGDHFLIYPQVLVLASTVERVRLSHDLIGRLEGKSSLGRLGLTAHITAGFFDPGFEGFATLELFNAAPRPIRLYPGMPICQMSFAQLSSPAERPYGHEALRSKYQGQERGPKESQMHLNFKENV